ncbi:MAG: glycosyltransferase [Luteitalea sp.]|nr:glycosyltransferase [Luteitalea sp.]
MLRGDDEGLGRCLVEAMAMELPEILTSGGAGQEIVTHGETGLVVPPGVRTRSRKRSSTWPSIP